MKQAFILLVSIAMVFVAPGAQGSAHLSFSNITANVTRTGCGTTRLCVETPEDCDPATDDPCLFTSVRAPNGTTLYFKLSGTISGDSYVAVARTANASEGTSMLYACGRNGTTNGVNGRFFFQVVQRNNTDGTLTVISRSVTGIQSLITNTKIQCVFHVPGVDASMVRNTVLLLGSGMVNGSTLGFFTANVTTPPLNLSNPASNINNPTTMSGANRALFPQALPLLLSIFILYILKAA
ncbi:putative ferric-chelate reductase 1 [Amphiprion ocellaris]|uniref:putative ferric-chelate reductase 1 n=1 Tax=Amphiprion ocellaris TaxID=80972 RepID=UPI002410CB54|nr:putative ferric-chelate reductase 1 [Amphiprion ocellaris]